MIWLTPVLQRIDAKREVHPEARQWLRQFAGELSGICGQRVPHAPAPQYEIVPDEGEPSVWCGSLGWFWVAQRRTLHIQVMGTEPPTLIMVHNEAASTLDKFNHEQLKASVLAFFDGWQPPEQLIFETRST